MGLSLSGLGGLVVPIFSLSYHNKIFNKHLKMVLTISVSGKEPEHTPSIFTASMKRDFRDSDKIQVVSSVVNSFALLCHSRFEGG